MPTADTVALCRTYRAYFALGNHLVEEANCQAIRNDRTPLVYDANHAWIGAGAEIEPALAFVEATFADRPYRVIRTDPTTPPAFDDVLASSGAAADPTLQLLLQGDLEGPAPQAVDLRRVESEADWRALEALFRADHVETDQKQGTDIFSEDLTRQIVSRKREIANDVHFFTAQVNGEAVAFFSSWPGQGTVGMVEDLFTLPSHRNRGIARALIHHCVADARARGADKILIGADPEDTPKNLYTALGFNPTCTTKAGPKTPMQSMADKHEATKKPSRPPRPGRMRARSAVVEAPTPPGSIPHARAPKLVRAPRPHPPRPRHHSRSALTPHSESGKFRKTASNPGALSSRSMIRFPGRR